MADTYASLVAESFASIAVEAPAAHQALTLALGDQAIAIRLDHEQFGVAARPIPTITAPAEAPDVAIEVSASTVRAVIDGDLSLADAVTNDHVRAVGSLDAIAQVHDALIAYVHGAIRSPAVPELRTRFDEIAGLRR